MSLSAGNGGEGERTPPRANPDGRSVQGRQAGRLSERVRRHVFEQIVSGKLKPGSIIQIGTLASELDVSRTPAREALLTLQQANLVEVVPNQGFLVRSLSVADVRDIYLMRGLLEGATAERAAERLSDEAIARLTAVNDRARDIAAGGKYDMTFDERCFEFHRQIAEAADSARLLAGVEAIFSDHMRLQSIGMGPPDPPMIVEEHQQILDAFADRDPGRAKQEMEAHIRTMHKWAVAALTE